MLKKIQPGWLLAAIGGQFMTYWLTGMEYLYLLKIFKLPRSPGIKQLSKAAIISLCFNQTVPSAGISGNLFYFRFLKRFNISREKILSLIIEELLIYYASMESFIIFLLCLLRLNCWHSTPLKNTLLTGMAIYPILGGIILLINRKGTLRDIYNKVKSIKWFKKKAISNEEDAYLKETIHLGLLIKNNRDLILKAYLLKLLISFADIFTLYVIFLGLGHTIPVYIISGAFIGTNIISLLPFAPGALILYESSMTYLFVSLGIPLSASIIATLVYRLLSFWLPMPAGTLLYRAWISNKQDTPA